MPLSMKISFYLQEVRYLLKDPISTMLDVPTMIDISCVCVNVLKQNFLSPEFKLLGLCKVFRRLINFI